MAEVSTFSFAFGLMVVCGEPLTHVKFGKQIAHKHSYTNMATMRKFMRYMRHI
jgi:hypothetical protein